MKSNYLLFLLSFALLFTACSEEFDDEQEKNVAVQIDLDVESSLGTRSISDGTNATQLMWAVFDADGNLIIKKSVKDNINSLLSEEGYSMSISLAKGKTYQVAFWAQSVDCSFYNVSDDMKVTIDYEGINNDENRDAFCATTEPFKVDNNTVVSVVLKRPFAQINVGAFPYDMEYAKETGLNVVKSSATIKNVPNVLNILDGSVEGQVDVNYQLSDIPAELLYVDVDKDGNKDAFDYLSMSYILAAPESSTHEMSFTFSDESSANTYNFTDGLGFVPAQRNWRTNIVGQILSGTMGFNIKIDPIYDGETINSGGLYYNFTDDTLIEDKFFSFNTNSDATFTSENNNLITMKNVTFSGRVQYIALGEYRDKGNYVAFRNDLTNVVAKNMIVDHPGIENVKAIDYMAPLIFLRGVSTLNDCEFTGTTTTAGPFTDNYGDIREVLPYDVGVPNNCEAVFNNCIVDRLYAWSHSMITLTNSKLKYIRCSTHNNSSPKAHLTIASGTEVDEIVVTSSGQAKRKKDENGKWHWIDDPENRWAPSLIIKSGATVNVLDMNGRKYYDQNGNLDVIIEEGAIVKEIINLAE